VDFHMNQQTESYRLLSVDSAIEAVRRGAYDYLCKPRDFPDSKKPWMIWPRCFRSARKCATSRRSCFRRRNRRASSGKVQPWLGVFDLAKKVARHHTNVPDYRPYRLRQGTRCDQRIFYRRRRLARTSPKTTSQRLGAGRELAPAAVGGSAPGPHRARTRNVQWQ
jgi:hypothetical protein